MSIQPLRRNWLAVIVVLLLPTLVFCADKKQDEAESLMSKASELSSLDAKGARPFHLYINFKLGGMVSGPMDGRFMWTSVTDQQWRREIKFADYSQVEVGGHGKVWITRTLDFAPKSATWVQQMVGNYFHMKLLPYEKVSRVYKDSHARCVELEREGSDSRILCFGSDGTLQSVQVPAGITIFQYSDYAKFGDKLFPRTLRVTTHNRLVVDARVDELAAEEAPYPGLFVPPPGAEERAGCQHPTPGRPVQKIQPIYPFQALQHHHSGTVTLYAKIAPDGTMQNLRVIETAGKDLDDAALMAVTKWKFSPYMCGNAPVPVETEIAINFTLQRE